MWIPRWPKSGKKLLSQFRIWGLYILPLCTHFGAMYYVVEIDSSSCRGHNFTAHTSNHVLNALINGRGWDMWKFRETKIRSHQ
jgi:hypothetical protein